MCGRVAVCACVCVIILTWGRPARSELSRVVPEATSKTSSWLEPESVSPDPVANSVPSAENDEIHSSSTTCMRRETEFKKEGKGGYALARHNMAQLSSQARTLSHPIIQPSALPRDTKDKKTMAQHKWNTLP